MRSLHFSLRGLLIPILVVIFALLSGMYFIATNRTARGGPKPAANSKSAANSKPAAESKPAADNKTGINGKPAADSMPADDITQGALITRAGDKVVECPLKHTDVYADISGFIARVTVTQTFENPYDEKIEARYVFPMSHTGAVDDMTMIIGQRRIVGIIKKREEAKAIYERAIQQGKTASLLDQERPNIFTQKVGNIAPKQEVKIQISYVDVLDYDDGTYQFQFPMVVGPRYIPGAPISKTPQPSSNIKGKVHEVPGPAAGPEPSGSGWSADTDRVPDASRITPFVLKPGQRAGHDISLKVKLNAGVPVHGVKVVNHKADIKESGDSAAEVALSPADAIPNKDFVMRYTVTGEKPAMALLSHSREAGDGYFMLMIQPKIEKKLPKAPPRELIFLVDVSGSMEGEPTEKNKQIMREFFKRAKKDDTFQVVSFADDAYKLFAKPVPVTKANIEKGLGFVKEMNGSGGTEMMKGVRMALDEPADPKRVRIVMMLTDGFIGNEKEIIDEVTAKCSDRLRFWAFGIGSSPNRYLIDGVAKQGGGMSAVVEPNTDPGELVEQAVERIHRAQLAKIEIDWNGLKTGEIFPKRIPELYVGRPVILFGRYMKGGTATVEVSGTAEGKHVAWPLKVTLPKGEALENDVLACTWARKKIDDLTDQTGESADPKIIEQVTQLALDYRIMSKYTSFVAVDEKDAPPPGKHSPPRKVDVPVLMPEGVSHEGVFGKDGEAPASTQAASNTRYIGGGGGDPWIKVTAPADARSVTAIFPTGDAKPLVYQEKSRCWTGRFDFPFGTAPGLYRVIVVIVYKNGRRARIILDYQNLVGGKLTAKTASLTAAPGERVTVSLESYDIQRAVALAPWGERVTLHTANGALWQGEITAPPAWPTGETSLTVVLLDGAHNRTEITVDLQVTASP